MIIEQFVTVRQESTETKAQFLNYTDELEKKGFKTVSGFSVNPQEELACIVMMKHSRLGVKNVGSSDFNIVDMAKEIVEDLGEGGVDDKD